MRNEKRGIMEYESLKKQIFSIPNLIGYFRILLIPVILWKYMTAEALGDYQMVAFLVAVSGLTDTLDGLIARRFHMITELGKVLDPIADKLTQIALVVCLAAKYELMVFLVILLVIKEAFMGIMGLVSIRKKKGKLGGAMWYGKVCTAVLYFIMFLLILLPNIPLKAANGMIAVCAVFMLLSLFCYGRVYYQMWRKA